MPHHASDASCDWATVCARVGLAYQSPSGEAEAIIRRIAGAERVVAESMHAAIIADAFGVPWRGAALSGEFNAHKWRDWSLSLGMDDPDIQPFYRELRFVQELKRRLTGRKGDTAAAATAGGADHRTTFRIARTPQALSGAAGAP